MVYSSPDATRWFMRRVREIERTADVSLRHGEVVQWDEELVGLDDRLLHTSADDGVSWRRFLLETSTDGILVLRNGRLAYAWCADDFAVDTPHLCHSITKSLASCVAGRLVARDLMDPDDRIVHYVPELARSAYGDATVRDLLDMTVGIHYTEDHEDEDSEDARLDRVCGVRPSRTPEEPGSAYELATTTVKEGDHGRRVHYVSLNTDVLGWAMERATGVAVPRLLHDELWSRLGAQDDAYIALDGAASAQLDGGFCCSLRDLARFGLMLAGRGSIAGREIVPREWIDDLRHGGSLEAFATAPDCVGLPRGWSYRSCFWIGARRRDTPVMCLGMYGQFLYVNIERQVVIAKFSSQEHATDDAIVVRTFLAFDHIARGLTAPTTSLIGGQPEPSDPSTDTPGGEAP
jgi:CubicO group peptidase (beta-lactamase class C family)